MRSLLRKRLTACLLHNDPASCSSAARLSVFETRSRSESESEMGDQLQAADPKRV